MSKVRQKRTEKPVRRTHQQRGELELVSRPVVSPGLINPTNEQPPQTLPKAARRAKPVKRQSRGR
jgi:hypothetical protein